jgi:hypothetical protein
VHSRGDVDPFAVNEQDPVMGAAYLVIGSNMLAISGLSAYGTVVLARDGGTLWPLAIPLGVLAGMGGYYAIRFFRSGIQFIRGPTTSSSATLRIAPSLRRMPGRFPVPAIHLRLRF